MRLRTLAMFALVVVTVSGCTDDLGTSPTPASSTSTTIASGPGLTSDPVATTSESGSASGSSSQGGTTSVTSTDPPTPTVDVVELSPLELVRSGGVTLIVRTAESSSWAEMGIIGTVRIDSQGCVTLAAPGNPVQGMIWPPGTTVVDDAIVIPGKPPFTDGSRLEAGGQTLSVDHVVERLGEEPPCEVQYYVVFTLAD